LQELLVKIVQSQTMKGVQEGGTRYCNPYLLQVIAIIRENLSSKLDLKLIAARAGLSSSSLYRLFKTELGISPLEFIMAERIKLAKQYLADKNIYIKNVSYETGFENSNYFIRVFKHYEGVTPKQYRQLLHKE
jgi:AraC-like DNA-binding protein